MSSNDRLARWWAARSTRSARLSTVSAESAAASRPPKATSSTATATKTAIIGRLPSSLGQREADQDVALDAEHLLLVVGLRVIEAEQVQHAVRRQQQQFIEHRMAGLLGLGHR